jgi:hypothetical protein
MSAPGRRSGRPWSSRKKLAFGCGIVNLPILIHLFPHAMKLTRHAIIPAVLAAAIGITAFAADEKTTAKKPAVSEEEMMKNWTAAATPGAEHKRLDAYAGSWNVHTKMWMAPDAPAMESDGTATAAWIFGGRYLEMNVKSEFMGQPFEGRSTIGYNNMRKTYESTWIDNMGTAISMMKGSFSADGKTFTYEGKMDDPMTGEKDKAMRFIETIVSPDEIHSEAHDPSLGKKSKVMEMVYKRKK